MMWGCQRPRGRLTNGYRGWRGSRRPDGPPYLSTYRPTSDNRGAGRSLRLAFETAPRLAAEFVRAAAVPAAFVVCAPIAAWQHCRNAPARALGGNAIQQSKLSFDGYVRLVYTALTSGRAREQPLR